MLVDLEHPIYEILDPVWKEYTDTYGYDISFIEYYEVKEYRLGDSFGKHTDIHGSPNNDIERKKEEFRKSKFLVVNSTGFDDYYLLRSNGLDTEEDTEFEVKENATTRGLVSAFSKYAGNRVNNRVILNRFIGLIS